MNGSIARTLLIALSVLLSVGIAVTVNVATGGSLPTPLAWLQPWAWALVVALLLLLTGIGVWQARMDHTARSVEIGRSPTPLNEAATPTVQQTIPQQLPAAVTNFGGRSAEIAQLDAVVLGRAVQQPSTVVITAIGGTAGVGKTALAVHWAHRVVERFPDGQLYANLQGYGPGPQATSTEVLGWFIRALGVPAAEVPHEPQELAVMYRSLLHGRKVLILLDNASSAEQVRPLVPGSPGCVVLVTSRSRLRGLTARDGATPISLDVLPQGDAVALLQRIVGERAAQDMTNIANLAQLCGRLPLALRIAGERVATSPQISLQQMTSELSDLRRRLDVLDDDDPATSLRSVFSWSYQALDCGTARMFRLLGLHSGAEFGVLAAAALVGVNPTVAVGELRRLTDAHLVEQAGAQRYRFHDLLRAYAIECLEDELGQDRDAALKRMLRWYLLAAVAADAILAPKRHPVPIDQSNDRHHLPAFGDRDEGLKWYETERLNLAAAVHQSFDCGLYAITWQLPAAIGEFLHLRRYFAELLELQTLGLQAASQSEDRCGKAWMHTNFGIAYVDLELHDRAVEHLNLAIPDLRELLNHPSHSETAAHVLGVALTMLGLVRVATDEASAAIDAFNEALTLERRDGNRWGEAWTASSLGRAYRKLGANPEAIKWLQHGLEIDDELGNRWRQGAVLVELGTVHQAAGNLMEAVRCYREALVYSRQLRNRWGEAEALTGLAASLCSVGDSFEAHQYQDQAEAILAELAAAKAQGYEKR